MQIITLHNTETEDIIGSVYSIEKINFDVFYDNVRDSFIKFHSADEYNDGDYSIQDFVVWHNNQENNNPIDWVIVDYIQLSERDLK